jgi:hypothetical protein
MALAGATLGQAVLPRVNAAAAVAGAALALGIAGDALLREWPLGLNVALWVLLLVAATLSLPRVPAFGLAAPRGAVWWLVAALAFAALLAVWASPALQSFNLLAVAGCLAMVAFREAHGPARLAGLSVYAWHGLVAAARGIAGTPLLLRSVEWRLLAQGRRRRLFLAAARGLAVAIPLVAVFATLFAFADVFFRDLLRDYLATDPGEVASHLALTLAFGWLAGSYLWATLLAPRNPAPAVPQVRSFRLGVVETGVVFGLVDAVFAAFVAIQFRYLFGGAGRVESSSTLTYAQYARRGFFELVAVAALVLPVILISEWLLARGRPGLRRLHTGLAGALVALVFVVIVSALERMRIYQAAYGLTELRLYTTALIAWLALLFAWAVATVLAGRRDRFAFGALVSGLAVLVALNALNPDSLIVRRNAAADRAFDADYALGLSADAVPALRDVLDDLPAAQRCVVAGRLAAREVQDGDWRSWNWGRAEARRARVNAAELGTYCP